jgi:beta-glucosidase
VTFDIMNTGSRAGAEIAQVYLGLPASAGEPPKRLVTWEKVQLGPGETRRVSLRVNPQMTSIFNVDKDAWEVLPGKYDVYVGGSSRRIRLTDTLHVSSPRDLH